MDQQTIIDYIELELIHWERCLRMIPKNETLREIHTKGKINVLRDILDFANGRGHQNELVLE